MRVCDLLTDPSFSELELLAGSQGKENAIASVTVVDTPDGAQWLTGGEFVITTGYMVGNNPDSQAAFLRILSQKKAAGLGIKKNRHISAISDAVLQLADQLPMPLISIPEHYSFVDIINPVLTKMVNHQYALMAQSSLIHDKFQSLAINDSTVPEILQALSLIVGVPSAFVDTYFREVYYSDKISTLAQSMDQIDPADISEALLENYDTYMVAKQGARFGYIFFPRGELKASPGNCVQAAVEQARIILILRMQTRISNQYAVEKYKGNFIEDILLNNIKKKSEIHNRAALYNWDFHNGGVVVTVDINNLKQNFMEKLDSRTNQRLEKLTEEIFALAIQEFQRSFASANYMKQSNLISFIISVPQAERSNLAASLREIFGRIQQKLKQTSPFTITIGVSNYYDNIADVHKSYAESRTSINLGYTLRWFDRILFYRDMELYRMLTPIAANPETQDFCERFLKPLEDYDRENGRELMDTLQEIVLCGWNLKKASENLFLHYNSMKYRYNKIRTIMNLDFDDHANRLMTEIAIVVYMMNRRQIPDVKQYTLP